MRNLSGFVNQHTIILQIKQMNSMNRCKGFISMSSLWDFTSIRVAKRKEMIRNVTEIWQKMYSILNTCMYTTKCYITAVTYWKWISHPCVRNSKLQNWFQKSINIHIYKAVKTTYVNIFVQFPPCLSLSLSLSIYISIYDSVCLNDGSSYRCKRHILAI